MLKYEENGKKNQSKLFDFGYLRSCLKIVVLNLAKRASPRRRSLSEFY